MKFIAPKNEPSKVEAIQVSDINYEKAYDEPSDLSVSDNGWFQTTDADNFNDHTEEY